MITKMMSSKIRVNYSATTDIMKYIKNQFPYIILQASCSPEFYDYAYQRERYILSLMKENSEFVMRQKKAVRVITSFIRKRRILRTALVKRMRKHEKKIIKIQALVKGHLVRCKFATAIKRIKRDAPKKTKKYQILSKIQAHVKGFLFRLRRKRALAKLNKRPSKSQIKDPIFEEDEFEEFDADKFFGIKEENFESGLSLP